MTNIIATGVTSGIGYETICKLSASMKGNYIVLYRNQTKFERLKEDLTSKGNTVDGYNVNLNDLQALRSTLDTVKKKYERIHLIIHCAGIWPLEKKMVGELEEAFIVNNLSPILINETLIDMTDHVLQVSAGIAIHGVIESEKTPYGEDFSKFGTYKNTKLWNLLTTYHYHLNYPNIKVQAIHPGVIKSNLGNTDRLFGLFLKFIKFFWKSPEYAANNILYIMNNKSNWFFFNEKEEYILSADLLNKENVDKVFQKSLRYINREDKSPK